MEPVEISASDARNELQRGLRVFKAFEHADKALAVLENLEQVQKERQTAADAAQASLDGARAELEIAAADVAAARAEAKQVRKDSKDKADAMVTAAEESAKAATTEAQGRVDALRAEADALVAQLLEKRGELEGIEAALADAKAVIERAERAKAALATVG